MGDVIKFSLEKNNTNNEIKSIFVDLTNRIKNTMSSVEDQEVLDEFNYLEGYITSLFIKVKNGNWKTEKKEEKYINLFKLFDSEKYAFSNLYKTYFLSLFTYLSDINSSILDEDVEYVDNIVESVDRGMESFKITDKELIGKILKDITKPIIKDVVNKSDDPRYALYDIIDGLVSGRNVLTVSSWYMNEEKEESIDINEPTIDQIRNYYLEQEKYRYIEKSYNVNDLDSIAKEHQMNVMFLSSIYLINGFDDNYKKIYIDITKKILSKNNIDEQIKDIINLTKVYLEYDEQIVELDKQDIEHYLRLGGKKYENR